MKLIKLNESQYKRLFEGIESLSKDNPSNDHESLSPSETPTMTVAATQGEDGETSFVDDKNKSRTRNYFGGSDALADVAAQDGYLTDKSRRY